MLSVTPVKVDALDGHRTIQRISDNMDIEQTSNAPDAVDTQTHSFAPMVFPGPSGKLAIIYSKDPEERAASTSNDFIQLIARKVNNVPQHDIENVVVGTFSLATTYGWQYKNQRDRGDLDEAIALAERAKDEAVRYNIDIKAWQLLLPELYLLKFEDTQMPEDLEEACYQLHSVSNSLKNHPKMRGWHAYEACQLLRACLEYLPNARLLDEGTTFAQISEESPAQNLEHYAQVLLLSGAFLFMKSDRSQSVQDLLKALTKLNQALAEGLPESDQTRAMYFISKARIRLILLTGQQEDREASKQTAEFWNKAIFGSNTYNKLELAQFSYRVWEKLHRDGSKVRKNFIDKAEKVMSEILLTEPFSQDKGFRAASLVLAGEISEACSETPEFDRQRALENPAAYWTRCWEMTGGSLHYRLRAIHLLSCRFFRQGRYPEAWTSFQKAIELIPIACPQHFDIEDKKHLVKSLHEISVDACATALALGDTDAALEVLEQGRGLFHSHFDNSSKDIVRLKRDHLDLFRKFETARSRNLHQGHSLATLQTLESMPDGNIEDLQHETNPLDKVFEEIRQLPTFENFLRPLTAKEIRSTAENGTIVVLVGSALRQYAILMFNEEVHHIDLHEAVLPEHRITPEELRRMSRETISNIVREDHDFQIRNRALRSILVSLWRGVVRPISDFLDLKPVDGPPTFHACVLNATGHHVTWMRTGDFHRLPVNMALDTSSRYPSLFNSRASSTFASSFRMLLTNRSRKPIVWRKKEPGFIISMPPTSGPTRVADRHETRESLRSRGLWIRNAREESTAVQEAAPNICWNLLERPSPQALQEQCLGSPFLHFICHGVSNVDDPMKSYLKLWNKPENAKGQPECLTVSQIANWTTTRSCIAFLSSCSTADAAQPTLFEENVDICNTLNLAGVHDVVGSMWPVPDKIGLILAEYFWKFFNDFMPDGEEHESFVVAQALNVALSVAAAEEPSELLSWAGFIHVGGSYR